MKQLDECNHKFLFWKCRMFQHIITRYNLKLFKKKKLEFSVIIYLSFLCIYKHQTNLIYFRFILEYLKYAYGTANCNNTSGYENDSFNNNINNIYNMKTIVFEIRLNINAINKTNNDNYYAYSKIFVNIII